SCWEELKVGVMRNKMATLDQWNERRKRTAEEYLQMLEGVCDLTLPYVPDWADPVWHLFVVRHPKRDSLQEYLNQNGVGTLIHYPLPPHLQAAYAELGYESGHFPISEKLADEVLTLPMC